VLGISEAGIFFRVTLPMALRGIVAGVLLAFARALGEFGATLMVAGNLPGRTQTLSVAIYEAVQAGDDDTANLLVLVTSVTCIVLLVVAARLVPPTRRGDGYERRRFRREAAASEIAMTMRSPSASAWHRGIAISRSISAFRTAAASRCSAIGRGQEPDAARDRGIDGAGQRTHRAERPHAVRQRIRHRRAPAGAPRRTCSRTTRCFRI
jgi:hypothetical protein